MIVTDKIDLQENETVVKRGDRVGFGKKGPDNGELILTNIALIYVKKNLFGKQKEVLRLPFSDIRTIDGKPQIQASNPDKFTPLMDVYTKDEIVSYKFVFDQDAEDWVADVIGQITGIPVEKKGEFDWVGDIVGMADSVSEGINKMKSALGIKSTEQVSWKCAGCGASISGIRGESIQCPYCGTYTTL